MASRLYRFIGHHDRNARFDRLEISAEDESRGLLTLTYDPSRSELGVELTDVELANAQQYVQLEEVDKDGIPVDPKKAKVSAPPEPEPPTKDKEGVS